MIVRKKFQVVTVGDCLVDHYIIPAEYKIFLGAKKWLGLEYGKKTPIKSFQIFPGGNALNTAVGFRRLGLKTAILSSVGTSDEAGVIFKKIKSEKIDSNLIIKSQKLPVDKGLIFVTHGERTVVSYHCKKNYQVPKNISTEWIYLTSLGDGFEKVYRGVLGQSAKIAFNPGSRQLKKSLSLVKKVIRRTDVLFVNVSESQKILGTKKNNTKHLLEKLFNLGAKLVIITNGAKGAHAFDGNNYYKIPAFPAQRLDASGAGDAFASGFTSAMILGKGIAEALRWGSINSAHEIAEIGVQNGLLNRGKLQKILKEKTSFQANKF